MEIINIQTTKNKEAIDITDGINSKLEGSGLCNIHVLHTTAAVACGDMDPGADLDYLDALDKIVPKLNYRHPHDPSHFPDHVLSLLVGTSVTLPFQNGKLELGTWQRIILFEFDGPRERQVVISAIK